MSPASQSSSQALGLRVSLPAIVPYHQTSFNPGMQAFRNASRFILLLLSAVTSMVFCSTATSAQTNHRSAVRSGTVLVQELDFDGLKRLINRNPEQRRPLLINFWATWCDPCRDEFPDLVKIDSQYALRGLEFVTVSLDDPEELSAGVPRFLREMNAFMPAYLLKSEDPGPAISYVDAQWSGALPATFLFNADGKLTYKRLGRINVVDLRAAIEKLVGRATQ
jgi:thiol-disulfide isomerase/thioredoxin